MVREEGHSMCFPFCGVGKAHAFDQRIPVCGFILKASFIIKASARELVNAAWEDLL